MTIGERIKERRLALGLSQRAVAAGCSRVSYAYVSRIEDGTRDPSIKALIEIAEMLGTTALFLMTGDEQTWCPCCKGRSSRG